MQFAQTDPSFQQPLNGNSERKFMIVWLVLQVAGSHVMLPILVVTFLATRAVRHPLLINMCLTWIITGIISCLLFYTGQYRPDGPSARLCLAQAAMIFATPPMTAASLLCLLYNVWYSIRFAVNGQVVKKSSLLRDCALLLFPYIVFSAFAIPGAVIVLTQPEGVTLTRHYFYCSVAHGPYSIATASTTAALLAFPLFFSAKLALMLCNNWVPLRRARHGSGCRAFYIMRVLILTGYMTIGLAFAFFTIFVPSIVPDMIMSTIPVFLGVLFGTSRDVWQAWLRMKLQEEQGPLEPTVAALDTSNLKFDDV